MTQYDTDQGRAEKAGDDAYSDAESAFQTGPGKAAFKKYRQDRDRRPKKRRRPIWRIGGPKIRRGKTENQNKNDAYEYKIQHGIRALAQPPDNIIRHIVR